MKKLAIAFLLAATSVFFTSSIAAQPKTVTDFFLAMPSNVYSTTISGQTIKSKAELTRFRRSLIKIEDVKNGYLRLEGPWEGWAEIALFKKSDGGYLVAESSVGCGPACDGSLKLYSYSTGKWTDVTGKFAPRPTDKLIFEQYRRNGGSDPEISKPGGIPYYFLLPREGRTVKIACNMCQDGEGDFVLLSYEWNGAAFVKN